MEARTSLEDAADAAPLAPSSEVGSEGPIPEEIKDPSAPAKTSNLLPNMEAFFTQLMAATRSQAALSGGVTTRLVQFDPDEAEADIEGWCNVTEIIVKSRKLDGAELLLVLTHALKGRAAACLTKLQASQLTWPQIKELLVAKFAKPLPQDYFDEILRFQIAKKETACEAATRLWNYIERIPRIEMQMITGLVTSVLSQKDGNIRRELHSHVLQTRAQLLPVLSSISTKKRHEGNDGDEPEAKKPRFSGNCHHCGILGHRQLIVANDAIIRIPRQRRRPKLTSTQTEHRVQPRASCAADRGTSHQPVQNGRAAAAHQPPKKYKFARRE